MQLTQQEIQEQAEKLLQASPDLVDERSFIQGFNSCAQWMQEREKWISVKTQTPPICGDGCLTSHKNGGVNITYFSRGYEEKDADYFLSVGHTHWMHLPSPPKD